MKQCKQKHGTGFVYIANNCEATTDTQFFVDHKKCIDKEL